MLKITVNRNHIINIVYSLTGIKTDDLQALWAMAPYAGSPQAVTDEKVGVLVGSQRNYKVAGVTFEGRQDVIKTLVPGEIIHFEHQPHNEHDPNAIAVKKVDGTQIGFLPKEIAEMAVDVISNLDGKIINIVGNDEESPDPDQPKFLGVRFAFIRKNSNILAPINIDAVTMLTESISGTSIEIAATLEIEKIAKTCSPKPEKHKADSSHQDQINTLPQKQSEEDEFLF
jgi:hypothetical protein